MKAERVVLDTNVLISAVLRLDGPPRTVVDAVRSANGVLLFSDETFEELRSRFHRPKFDRYVGREVRAVYLAQLEAVSEWVSIAGAKLGCRDPDDDKLLETALMGEADCLVTGDRDLLEMSPFNDIPILTPADFLGFSGRWIKAIPICGVSDAALFRGIEISVDAVSDARGGCLDGVAGKMGITSRRLDLRVSEQFADHGQALAERQRS